MSGVSAQERAASYGESSAVAAAADRTKRLRLGTDTPAAHEATNDRRRRLRYGDYKVGWICALPLEMAAAEAMLDEFHELLPEKHGDSNAYTLGSIASQHRHSLSSQGRYGEQQLGGDGGAYASELSIDH